MELKKYRNFFLAINIILTLIAMIYLDRTVQIAALIALFFLLIFAMFLKHKKAQE